MFSFEFANLPLIIGISLLKLLFEGIAFLFKGEFKLIDADFLSCAFSGRSY